MLIAMPRNAYIQEEPGPFMVPVFRAYREDDHSPLYMGSEDRVELEQRLKDEGFTEVPALCRDTVKVGREGNLTTLTCSKPHGHPVVGINHPHYVRKYEFHEGDGWLWDERCAWEKGKAPEYP